MTDVRPSKTMSLAEEYLQSHPSCATQWGAQAIKDFARWIDDAKLPVETQQAASKKVNIDAELKELRELRRAGSDSQERQIAEIVGRIEYELRDRSSVETTAPQAPIARIRIGLTEGFPPSVEKLYSPGLPHGEYDVYLDPSAPGIRAEEPAGDGGNNT